MQALVELIAGLIAMLAAVTLSQFGVDLTPRAQGDREIHRVAHCEDTAPADGRTLAVSVESQDC